MSVGYPPQQSKLVCSQGGPSANVWIMKQAYVLMLYNSTQAHTRDP